MPKENKPDITFDIKQSLESLKANLTNKANKLTNPEIADYDPELFWYGPPVSPREFVQSTEYFGNSETGQIYPWVVDTLEEIFSGKYYAPKYTTAAIVAGKGSGKSVLAALANAYLWYWLLSFKNFSKYLKDNENVSFDSRTTIQLVGMAKNARQAKEIIFDTTSKFLYQVKAFRDRNWLPDPNIKTELQYSIPDENMPNIKHKKLIVVPGNSSETFALGFAIFAGVIDEAAFFREKLDDPVKGLYSEFNIRRQTRFKNNGIIILISSARSDGDFIESFEDEAKTNPLIYFKRISTYDCKPEYFAEKRFDLTVHHETSDGQIEKILLHPPISLLPFYERNRDEALRDYDGIPTVAGSPFYRDFTLLISKLNKERQDPAPDKGMEISETPDDIWTALPPWFKGSPNGSYKIHVDLAKGAMVKGQCGCGFAMTHKVADAALGFRIVLDLSIRFKVAAGKEVNVNEILTFIKNLKEIKGFNITKVTFDEYNSISPIQTINSWQSGIVAEKLSVGYKEHTFLKTCFYSGQFDAFHDDNLLFELKRLEDYETCVEAGVNSFKDEADAVAGAVFDAADLKDTKVEPLKPRIAAGIVVNRGGSPAVRAVQGPAYRNSSGTPKYWR